MISARKPLFSSIVGLGSQPSSRPGESARRATNGTSCTNAFQTGGARRDSRGRAGEEADARGFRLRGIGSVAGVIPQQHCRSGCRIIPRERAAEREHETASKPETAAVYAVDGRQHPDDIK